MMKENTIFSLEYFNTIRELNANYLNYIKSFNTITKEYTQKLFSIQRDKDAKTKEIINNISEEQTKNLSSVIKITSTFPTFLHIYIENIYNFIVDLEREIKNHETYLKEKDILLNEIKSKFEEAKNNYIKKNNEIEKSEQSFLNNMSKTEEILYEFYFQEKKGKKEHKKRNIASKIININLNNNQNIVTQEQVNNCVNKALKSENIYQKLIESGNLSQENYIQTEISSSENIKNIILDLSKKCKISLLNILVSFKNNLKNPIEKIDRFLSDLNEIDEKQIIEKAIKNHFENNTIKKIELIPKKYDLKIIKKDKYNKEDIKVSNKKKLLSKIQKLNIFKKKGEHSLYKNEDKISVIEDGLEVMNFIDDEFALLTIKKMINDFKLINDGGYKIKEEEEKITTKNLINKIFVNFKRKRIKSSSNDKPNNIKDDKIIQNLEEEEEEDEKEENNNTEQFTIINLDNEIINITEDEILSLEVLLEKHYNRVIFFQQLNKFRATGKLIIPKKIGELIAKFFNIILNTVKRDNDTYSFKNIVLLSQTYYILENNKNKYLQELIMDNQIFKDNKFWEDLLDLEIYKQIKRCIKTDENKLQKENMNLEEIKNMNEKRYSTLIHSQFITICDNMVSFGMNKEEIYKIIDSKVKEYYLSQEVADNIKNIVELRIKEENEQK